MIINRIVNLWQASIGASLTNLETERAEELLELERDELHRKVSEYNRGLASYAGLCERLRAQIKGLESERRELAPKLRARLPREDRTLAGRYALRLEAIDGEVESHKTQLHESESTYRELLRARELAVSSARENLEGLKRTIGDYKTQKALAELTELAAGMQGTLGMSNGTLERIRERVQDKRDFAAGRVRVARESLDTAETRMQEAERTAMAEDALRRFEAAHQAQAKTHEQTQDQTREPKSEAGV